MAGSEVRLHETGTKKLLGINMLDTSSGYNSKIAMPVHFGLSNEEPVDVEIAALTVE